MKITGDPSGAIEAQESAGQKDLLYNEVLPYKGSLKPMHYEEESETTARVSALEEMGFEFGEEEDELFVRCKFPCGWKKEVSNHYWTTILDDKGNKRGSMFYKAAFYDRGAHVFWSHRYTYEKQMSDGSDYYDHPKDKDGEIIGVILDRGKVIWKTAPIRQPARNSNKEGYYHAAEKADSLAREALRTKYPNHKNALAYWDSI